MKKSFIKVVPKENTSISDILFLKDKEYSAFITSENMLLSPGENTDGMVAQIGGITGVKPYFKDNRFSSRFTILNAPITLIETDIHVPHPTKKGYLKYLRQKTVVEVYDELVKFLKENDLYTRLDYFNITTSKEEFPKWNYLCCYAFPGSNEGYYVHVDVIVNSGERICIFTGKLLSNIEEALEISNEITKVFYDEFR